MAEQLYTDFGENAENKKIVGVSISKRKVALTLLNELSPLMASMERLVNITKRFQMMLYEPSLLFKFRKDWIGFLVAVRLYIKYKSGKIDNAEAKNYTQQIKSFDDKFAEDIEIALPTLGDNSRIFYELLNELKKGKQYFVSYIVTHSEELIEKVKSVKDKDPQLSQKLVDLLTAISGHEVDYLIKYRQDCEDWLHYAVGYNLDFFINRIGLFLNGGSDISSRTQFKGLYKDFSDEKIQGIILRNNSVRNLVSYLNQLKYLNLLIGMCRRAYVSGDWDKGFFGSKGFWTDFDKYAGDFEKVYGNVDFKERLMAIERKKAYELPQFWGGVWEKSEIQDITVLRQQGILYTVEGGVIYIIRQEGILTKLVGELYSQRYQINNIIHPAAAALMRIFEERENELKVSRNQKVRDLIKLLLSVFGVPKLRKFRKLLKEKKRMLLRELNNDMAEFISKNKTPSSDYQEIADDSEEQNNALDKVSAYYLARKTLKFVKSRDANLAYVYGQLETGHFLRKNHIEGLTLTGIGEGKAEILQSKKLAYENYEHLTEEDFEYLQSLIPRIRDAVRRFIDVYGHIRFVIEHKYILKPEALEMLDMDVEKRKNRKYELTYVERMISRLI